MNGCSLDGPETSAITGAMERAGLARSKMSREDTLEIDELESLPAVGGVSDLLRPLPPASSIVDEPLEELPEADEPKTLELSKRSEGAAQTPASVSVSPYTIRDLLKLVSSDLPVVAVEGGVYRIQQQAYGPAGGLDPNLHRLAASVIGSSSDDQSPADGDPLRLLASGIDLDTFSGGAECKEAGGGAGKEFSAALLCICRRAGAVGAALMVSDASGTYQPQRAVGLLRRLVDRLNFTGEETVVARYLYRRIALIVDGPLRLVSGIDGRFMHDMLKKISRFAFLPAQACGRPAYLLLTARPGDGPWDAARLVSSLRIVGAG